MTNPTIQITVDTKDAIQALNELHHAIERVRAAVANLHVSVKQEAATLRSNNLTADRIVCGGTTTTRVF